MSTGNNRPAPPRVPVRVLVARLANVLTTAHLHNNAGHTADVRRALDEAEALLIGIRDGI